MIFLHAGLGIFDSTIRLGELDQGIDILRREIFP